MRPKKILVVPLLWAFAHAVTSASGSAPQPMGGSGNCTTQHRDTPSYCSNVDCETPGVFLAPAQGMQGGQIYTCCTNPDSVGTVNVPPHNVHSSDYPYGCCSVISDPPTLEPASQADCPTTDSI